MKKERQKRIVELIESGSVETQEDLVSRLKEAGFPVTQATISRDIRELNLTKIAGADGRQRYVVMTGQGPHLEEKYVRVLKAGFVSAETAENMLIIKTVAGMAMAVAAALDALKFPHIVGCIAGDDTIFAAVKAKEFTQEALRDLTNAVEG